MQRVLFLDNGPDHAEQGVGMTRFHYWHEARSPVLPPTGDSGFFTTMTLCSVVHLRHTCILRKYLLHRDLPQHHRPRAAVSGKHQSIIQDVMPTNTAEPIAGKKSSFLAGRRGGAKSYENGLVVYTLKCN